MKITRLTLFVSFCSYIFFASIKTEPCIILKLRTTPYNIVKSIEKSVLLQKANKTDAEKIKKLAKKTDFKNINALQFIASALINFNTISEEIFYIEDEIIKEYA